MRETGEKGVVLLSLLPLESLETDLPERIRIWNALKLPAAVPVEEVRPDENGVTLRLREVHGEPAGHPPRPELGTRWASRLAQLQLELEKHGLHAVFQEVLVSETGEPLVTDPGWLQMKSGARSALQSYANLLVKLTTGATQGLPATLPPELLWTVTRCLSPSTHSFAELVQSSGGALVVEEPPAEAAAPEEPTHSSGLLKAMTIFAACTVVVWTAMWGHSRAKGYKGTSVVIAHRDSVERCTPQGKRLRQWRLEAKHLLSLGVTLLAWGDQPRLWQLTPKSEVVDLPEPAVQVRAEAGELQCLFGTGRWVRLAGGRTLDSVVGPSRALGAAVMPVEASLARPGHPIHDEGVVFAHETMGLVLYDASQGREVASFTEGGVKDVFWSEEQLIALSAKGRELYSLDRNLELQKTVRVKAHWMFRDPYRRGLWTVHEDGLVQRYELPALEKTAQFSLGAQVSVATADELGGLWVVLKDERLLRVERDVQQVGTVRDARAIAVLR